MNNSAKITLALVLVFLILLSVTMLSPDESPATTETAAVDSNIDVPAIIDEEGCVACHGEDLAGTENAPSLKNLSSKYTLDALASYLKNPVKNSKVEYSMEMPGVEHLEDAQVKALANYLLK